MGQRQDHAMEPGNMDNSIDFNNIGDPDIVTLYCAPFQKGWGVSIGGYPAVRIGGFESGHEAYMWCLQTLLVDPLVCGKVPERFRQEWFLPEEKKTEQVSLFEMENE
jgi:hypothetical protein